MNSDIQDRKEPVQVVCARPKPAAQDLFPDPLPETHHNSASIPLEVPNELLSRNPFRYSCGLVIPKPTTTPEWISLLYHRLTAMRRSMVTRLKFLT